MNSRALVINIMIFYSKLFISSNTYFQVLDEDLDANEKIIVSDMEELETLEALRIFGSETFCKISHEVIHLLSLSLIDLRADALIRYIC